MAFLHGNGIIHADIKLTNILMDGDRGILSDFDVSSDRTFFDATLTQGQAPGTLNYMAPELFEAGNGRVTTASDMYSFGVVMYLAHFGDGSVYLAPQAAHATIPVDRDANLRLFLESLLSRDPAMRPSADEALASEYFRAVADNEDERSATTSLEIFREMLRLNKLSSGKSFPIRAKLPADGLNFVPEALKLFASLRNQTKPLRVKFVGEKALDGGAVTSSLYRRFFVEVLQRPGLFERRGNGTFLPSINAPLEDMLAFGVALARCVYDERIVELPLASAVYKFLMGAKLDFNDLEAYDEVQSASLKQILRLPGVETLSLTFEYCGGSSSVIVNDLNKEDFVQQKILYELVQSRIQQLEKIKEGFWSLGCLGTPLRLLGWRELVVVLSGASFLTADMLLDCVHFDLFDAKNVHVIEFFSEAVREMSTDDLRLLLYYVTEQPTIPFGGLKNPRGHAPVDRITVRASRAAADSLPTASVCFYLMHLPQYPSKEELKAKLLLAIRECGTSFSFL